MIFFFLQRLASVAVISVSYYCSFLYAHWLFLRQETDMSIPPSLWESRLVVLETPEVGDWSAAKYIPERRWANDLQFVSHCPLPSTKKENSCWRTCRIIWIPGLRLVCTTVVTVGNCHCRQSDYYYYYYYLVLFFFFKFFFFCYFTPPSKLSIKHPSSPPPSGLFRNAYQGELPRRVDFVRHQASDPRVFAPRAAIPQRQIPRRACVFWNLPG